MASSQMMIVYDLVQLGNTPSLERASIISRIRRQKCLGSQYAPSLNVACVIAIARKTLRRPKDLPMKAGRWFPII